MDLDATKIKLVELLLKVKEEGTLYKIKSILDEEASADWWENLSNEERAAIELGKKQADEGLLIPHDEVMNVFDKWRTK